MAYDGYLALGGVEIINTERARGYMSTADCACGLREGCQCDGIADAAAVLAGTAGDSPATYDYAEIDQAPWYDGSQPDLSSRFLGVAGLRLSGLYDSTRSAEVTEGLADGGVVGRQRRTTREVRATALLMAKGRDALFFGARWLDAALDPSACGRHGGACGTTDAVFFIGCPPARDFHDPIFGAWEEESRNYVLDPGPYQAASDDWTRATNATYDGRMFQIGRMRAQYTAVDPAEISAIGSSVSASVPVDPTKAYRASIDVSMDLRLVGQFHEARIIAGVDGGASFAIGDWTSVGTFQQPSLENLSVEVPAGANTIYAYVQVRTTNGSSTGPYYLANKAIIPLDSEGPDFFDGNTPEEPNENGDAVVRYVWTGAVGGSASARETREIEYQETDAEYLNRLDPTLRYLHDVSVVSGPIELEEFGSDDCWTLEVEFTFVSERPFVYARPVEIDPSGEGQSVVDVDDVAYNLMRAPEADVNDGVALLDAIQKSYDGSAELSSGSTPPTATTTGSLSGSSETSVSQEVSYVDARSFVFFTETQGAGAGTFDIRRGASLGGYAVGPGFSCTLWASIEVDEGVDVSSLHAEARLNNSGTLVETVDMGTITSGMGGHLFQAIGIVPSDAPSPVTGIGISLVGTVEAERAGSRITVYLDAIGVTRP